MALSVLLNLQWLGR